MNYKFYSIVCILLFLPGCFFNNTETISSKRHFLIQAFFDAPMLTSIKETITPIINSIIKEELGLEKEYDFDFFLPKKRQLQALTLYYVDDMYENGQPFLFSAVENLQKNRSLLAPNNVSIAPKIDFFGDHKDELVIM